MNYALTEEAVRKLICWVSENKVKNVTYIPIVMGNQTTSTDKFTGKLPLDNLEHGQSIRYWLPYVGSENGNTLNLTLADGTTTGDIPIYYKDTTPLTTQYTDGSLILMTYIESVEIDGKNYTGWWCQLDSLSGEFIKFKKGEYETLKTEVAKINSAYLDEAKVNNLIASKGYITTLETNSLLSNYAKVNELQAVDGKIDTLISKAITTDNLSAQVGEFGYLKASSLSSEVAKLGYATIDLANVKNGSITQAMIGDSVVGTTQIADGSITDAKIVELTANKITAGTLSVERLEIRGSNTSIVYALNNISGALQAQNVNTLNGEILTPRSITADKIVANAITSNEIAANAITANKILAGAVTADKISVTTLESIAAKIGGFNIGSSYISNNTTTLAGNNNSIYLGLDGISCGTTFKVDATGALNATSGHIGGAVISASALTSAGYTEGDVKYDDDGNLTTGSIKSGIKLDFNNCAFYTPQISITRDYIDVKGYVSIGTRNTDEGIGTYSFTQGAQCGAYGPFSHAQGRFTYAAARESHSEGFGTAAEGNQSHAEGGYTLAQGNQSHSEGYQTNAIGERSHAEGYGTYAEGVGSHAEGCETTTTGEYSHAEGYNTIASGNYQHVSGKYNIEDTENKYAYIIGNGKSNSARANAHTVDWDGNAYYAGTITANSGFKGSGDRPTYNGVELALRSDVDSGGNIDLSDYAKKADIATTVMQGTAVQNTTYWKISNFGNWGTGNWTQKGFSMLITSRAGETVWVSLSANDSNTTARAIRLMNSYSKINALHYSVSESAIYVTAISWANNICAHILSNVNGDYVPTIASASGLPSDAVAINIVEFGINSDSTVVGDSSVKLALGGSATRPTYNGTDLVLHSDLSNYAPADHNHQLPSRLANYQSSGGSDANGAVETGFYYINGSTNRPSFNQSTNVDYRILTTAYSDQWLQQIATDFRCDDIFYRRRESGTWTSWRKLAFSDTHLAGGLMTGSLKFQSSSLPQKTLEYICGIDAFAVGGEMGWQSKADFLAGYATTAQLGSYLPLSGGTLYGALTFANGTMNTVGDDVQIGDQDVAGTLCVKGTNGTTAIQFMPYNSSAVTAKIMSNDVSSYGGLRVTGLKNSYHGILFGDDNKGLNIMSCDPHQGLYNESNGRWILYYNRTYDQMGIGTAPTTQSSYKLDVFGSTRVQGDLNITGNITGGSSSTTVESMVNTLLDYHNLRYGGGTIGGNLTVNGGMYLAGRYYNSGDDEGLVIGKADNGYAGLTLGGATGLHTTLYLMPDNSAVWRYHNGSASYDIKHPQKAGTIALLSDIPSASSGSVKTMDVIWTNPSPTAAYNQTTLSLNVSPYRYIVMCCNFSTNYPKRIMPSGMCKVEAGYQGACITPDTVRTITIDSMSQVSIGGAGNGTNTNLVPCYIIGIY